MLKKRISFLFFFLSLNLFSQNVISAYKDSIVKYIYNNPDKAIQISHNFLKTEGNKEIENKIISYSYLGVAYEIKNEIDSTLYYYYKCLNLLDRPIEISQYKYSIGVIYENEYNYKDALELYSQALKIAKEENHEKAIYSIKSSIASIKNKIGQSKEALDLILEVYERNKKTNDINLKFNRKALIEIYLNIKMTAEANIMLEEGLQEAVKSNNYEFQYYLYKLKSQSDIIDNKFNAAKHSAEKALENAKKLSNNEFIDEANYTLATSLLKKENYASVITIINSILNNNRTKTIDQSSKYYKLLAETYKQSGNESLSNAFYQKYIEQLEKINKKRLSTLESIHNITLKSEVSDIETTFQSELKEETLEKDKQKKTKQVWAGLSIALILLVFGLILFFKNKAKTNQKRFDDLMLRVNAFEKGEAITTKAKENTLELIENPEANKKIDVNQTIQGNDQGLYSTYIIDDKKVEEILNKVKALEDKKYYLRQDCTLPNMAKKLKTNTSYLSKVINTYLGKSFSIYINELRINHAIIELKNNRRLRAYSVKSIAGEMGFKSVDAFTRYFKAATGITPSIYIKKIKEL